jgi:hypothetical protein
MMSFVCVCTGSEPFINLVLAIFVGLTKTRIADTLSASEHSPLSFAGESL